MFCEFGSCIILCLDGSVGKVSEIEAVGPWLWLQWSVGLALACIVLLGQRPVIA